MHVKTALVAAVSIVCAQAQTKPAAGGEFLSVCHMRVTSVADSVCSVTKVELVENTDTVSIDFVLTPELESDICCRMELPPPERWDGRLWGVGNGGFAGIVPSLVLYRKMNTAAVTTDLGTRDAVAKVKNVRKWPLAVQRDYQWRGTHLMTVYAKQIAEACYGKPPRHSYFDGGSCGGRQGFSEAIRFPGDYDGIVSHVPSENTQANHLGKWLIWRQTHDDSGKLLFTKEEMQCEADAAVEYFATRDPRPYAGHFLADGRVSPEDLDEILAIAAKKMPSLRKGDKLARLKGLHTPFLWNGECLSLGFAPGTYFGDRMNYTPPEESLTDLLAFVDECGPWYNANAANLDAFFKRGGKLIMTVGWEDQTLSPFVMVEHYERICAHEGGIENAMRHCRLFCAPGAAHGGGMGRASQGFIGPVSARKAIVDWVENGVAPERIMAQDRPRKTMFPLAVYPGLMVADGKGGWKRVERPRSKIQLSDRLFRCDPSPSSGGEDGAN